MTCNTPYCCGREMMHLRRTVAQCQEPLHTIVTSRLFLCLRCEEQRAAPVRWDTPIKENP